ncbi:hypothetical protein [Henriciella litoralis]|uniref:hypothetical protein n=1 Tax=Henriciella litoralis TaxID=568102 RepID=UPI00111C2310|nr:hypothetical protein [Henriciella litoralis]
MENMLAFIKNGLATLKDALQDAWGLADIDLYPTAVTHAAARRLSASLRFVTRLLRRVLVLMALEIEVELSAKPKPENPGDPASQAPQLIGPSFAYLVADRLDPNAPRAPETRPSTAHLDPPDLTKLHQRYQLLKAMLENPAKAARRMAFRLRRLRANGEMRPVCTYEKRPRRNWQKLDGLPNLLAFELNAGLRRFFSSS